MRGLRLTEAQYSAMKAGRPVPRANRGTRWCDLFAAQLEGARIPHQCEYRFHPTRRFRFDFALLGPRIAVEIDGIVHRIENRFREDREKGNLAIALGWRVLHFAPEQVRSGEALETLKRLI